MNIFWRRKNNNNNLGVSLNAEVWRKFKKNIPAMASLFIIGLFVVVALLGYLITPDSTPYCNQQYLELNTQKPLSKNLFLQVKLNQAPQKSSFFKKMLFGKPLDYRAYPIYSYQFVNDSILVEEFTGSIPNGGEIKKFHLADVAFALSPNIAPIQKDDKVVFTDIENQVHTESVANLQKTVKEKCLVQKRFWLGSDKYGRDVLSQLLIGTRVSLSVGFIAIVIALLIGILLGSLAAYYGKWVDTLIVWFINVVWSIPTILLVIAITFALGKGFWQVFIAVGLTMWVDIARIVRGQILSIREKEFVESAKALGYKNFRIITKHILPNIMGAVIVITASNFASAILLEAGLSFLGIGIQPPMVSWGAMLKENYAYIILDSAYLAILPGLAIMLLVLTFMLVGNGLRDALDVKGKV